jgi:heme/copper-type cytochrome/quinol oxidase subunit 2
MAADPAAANIARGYFWSILFMLSMPILILTGLGSYFYWEVRRAYARQAMEDALQAEEPRPAVPQS